MTRMLRVVVYAAAVGLVVASCTSGASAARNHHPLAHWAKFVHEAGVVDLAGPRADGTFVVAARGRLFTLSAAGRLTPFAAGPGGYAVSPAGEPYITLAGNDRVAGTRCAFRAATLFALLLGRHPGIIQVTATGRATHFASAPAGVFLSGITFDRTGRFGHRLLVTAQSRGRTLVLAVDCAGRVATVARIPVVEGGMAVAPLSFGRYGGDLIAADEFSGKVYAVRPNGTFVTLAVSGLPHGKDTGVESAGFLPPRFGAKGFAYLADRFTRGSRHPGTNSILRLPDAALVRAGVRPGDLLVATEASARTIVVHCARTCTVRLVAIGPAVTHAEGHVVFG